MRSPLVLACLAACGGPASPLYPAGSAQDEGHGDLAQASSKLMTSEGEDDLFATTTVNKPRVDDGEDDGAYGGDPYGGTGYGGYVVPQWTYQSVNRVPKHNQQAGLAGAIEGVITWKGALPEQRKTPCGALDALPVGDGRGLADVLVYIERVQIGRTIPIDSRPIGVGGLVVKRGCALLPAVQIVTPLPAPLAIHGDAQPAKLVITTPPAPPRPVELEAGGRAAMQAAPGVTRIDSSDGSLTSAWVHALDTPYYAITDDRGRFRIDELAAGTYDVTIWQAPIFEAGKYGAPIVVTRRVKVEGTRPARLDVALGR